MDPFKSSFLSSTSHLLPVPKMPFGHPKVSIKSSSSSSIRPDPWSLSDGNPWRPKPRWKNPKHPLSDDDARRIMKKKAQYLSVLRRNVGSGAATPRWIKRSPEQMVQYLEDDRNGQLYGKHVVAAIKAVRGLAQRKANESDVRVVMSSFVGKLSFREMCVVLKEQKSWRQVRDFFGWMKLQLSYRPSVVVYTIVLRLYGQVGKIKLAEQTFLEMLEVGCEPDEVACGTMLCAYARWGRHIAMMTFYDAVQERGVVLSNAVYNFMLSSLQKKSLHGKVIDLWNRMKNKRVGPNVFTYTVVISSLVKKGIREEALKTFEEMKNLGFVPEEVTYSLLISLTVKDGDWDKAVRLYEDMRSRGIVPSNYTCASMLTLFYKTEDYPKALSLFGEMDRNRISADEVIRGLLIRIYGKLGLYEDAESLFEETERLNLLTDEKTYLAMSQVLLNSGNVDKALNIIQLMRARNVQFSRFAYIVMLRCYVKKEDLGAAEGAFQAISRTGFPDVGSCSDMLNLYLKLDLVEKAKEFIARIKSNRVDFDEDLYMTAMRVYCKEGMVKEAQQLTEKLGRNVPFKDNKFIQTIMKAILEKSEEVVDLIQPNPMALGLALNLHFMDGNSNKVEEILCLLYKTDGGSSVASQIISSFIREGEFSKAGKLTDLIIKLGYRLEEETIATLIGHYGRQYKLEEAHELFVAARESFASDKPIINSMIDAYIRCGRSEAAYALYKESAERGLDMGAVTISVLVNALTNYRKHREAGDVVHKSLEANLQLDTVAYNTCIKAMLEAGKLQFASEIYKRMVSLGVPPSIQTYSTMISVYGRGQQLGKAAEIFSEACKSGLSLDEKAYMSMISCYGKAGKMHEASILFVEMQKKGIKPGTISYNIMINIYANGGLCHGVDNLLQAMKRDGCSLDSFTYLSLIQAYVERLKYTEAEETLISMEDKGISPSCGHFNLLLSAFAKAGMMVEAERIYNKMLRAGISPDLPCLRTMLSCYLNCGCTEKGVSFYETIKESAEADRFIMSAAVRLYKAAGKICEAQGVLDSMKCLGVPFLRNLVVRASVKPLQSERC